MGSCSSQTGALENATYIQQTPLAFVFAERRRSGVDQWSQVVQFSRHFRRVHFEEGQRIIAQGKAAEEFFVIAEGRVAVYVTGKDGRDRVLGEKQAPDFFGEMGMHFESEQCWTASVVAVEYTMCLSITKAALRKFLSQATPDVRAKLLLIMGRRVEKSLSEIPFLSHLSPSELQLLGTMVKYRILNRDEILFKRGNMGTDFFIVYSGRVTARGGVKTTKKSVISKPTKSRKSIHIDSGNTQFITDGHTRGSVHVVGRSEFSVMGFDGLDASEEVYMIEFGPGEFLGELGLVMGIPRTATVIADETSLLFVLEKDVFRAFLRLIDMNFDRYMKVRLLEYLRNRYKQLTFFNAIHPEKLSKLADYCKIEVWQPNKIVFRQGDPGDRFYIIAYGSLAVVIDNSDKVLLGPGNYTGEIAIVLDTKRTATVKSVERAITLSIGKRDFQQFFKSEAPQAVADFELKLAKAACRLTTILQHPIGIKFFRIFVESEFSSENLEFWEELHTFRSRFRPDAKGATASEEMRQSAQKIYDEFVKVGSEQEMNLTKRIRQKISDSIAGGRCDYLLFVDAQREIEDLMSRDTFMRFKKVPFSTDIAVRAFETSLCFSFSRLYCSQSHLTIAPHNRTPQSDLFSEMMQDVQGYNAFVS